MRRRDGSTTRDFSNNVQEEHYSESFLSILDDKNKTIATLQKQLHNQKLQLLYYLKKEIDPSKLQDLSYSCSPEIFEENMPVVLAMRKFKKKHGLKTNVYNLYERMCHIDKRIVSSLEDQEFVLKKIVSKLCKFLKQKNNVIELKIQFGELIGEHFYIDLFSELLETTVSLRKKLDIFRICCNRLIAVEDERNNITDQVFSLPIEQRMNFNYLISIQLEKAQLEKEISHIIRNQKANSLRLKELNIIEDKLWNLQTQLKSSFIEDEESWCVNAMLDTVNVEANYLLERTKKHKEKYQNELPRTNKLKTPSLNKILSFIRIAMETEETNNYELVINKYIGVEEIETFDGIMKELNEAKIKFSSMLQNKLNHKNKECEALTKQLEEVALENNKLKIGYSRLQMELDTHKNDLLRLKNERDTYQSQVGELELIREAYTQLVGRHSTSPKMESDFLKKIQEKDRRIKDMKNLNNKQAKKLKIMNNIINKQNNEILLQSEFIENLKESVSEKFSCDITNSPFIKSSCKTDSIHDTGQCDITWYKSQHSNDFEQLFEQNIMVSKEVLNCAEELQKVEANIIGQNNKKITNKSQTNSLGCVQFSNNGKYEETKGPIIQQNKLDTKAESSMISFGIDCRSEYTRNKETVVKKIDSFLENSSKEGISSEYHAIEISSKRCSIPKENFKKHCLNRNQLNASKSLKILAEVNSEISSSSEESN